MRKLFLVLTLFALTLGGCGDIEWFPDQGVDDFSFSPASVTDVSPGSEVTSNAITLQMRTASELISITGGEYKKNSEEFTSNPGTVKNGDVVTVRHDAASETGQTVTTTLTIGKKTATFSSTTGAPLAFTPPLRLNVEPGSSQTSNSPRVSLPGASAAISITGGEYSINGGTFTSTAGTINRGQTVTVRHQAAEAGATGADATKITELTIGGVKTTFASSITDVATQTVNITAAEDGTSAGKGMSLVSGTVPLTVLDSGNGLGEVSVDGTTYWGDSREVSLTPGQLIHFKDVIVPVTAVVGVGNDQIINFVVTPAP